MSYLAIGVFKPSQWLGLYDGSIPWTTAPLQAQLTQWHQLYVNGCVNKDALTDTNNLGQFVSGKAAMTLDDGSWDVAQFTQQMGTNVGAIVPPFSTKPQHGVVYFPGDAISVMKQSSHVAAAASFLAFMDSPAGAAQIAKAGLIPDISHYSSTNALNKQMLGFVPEVRVHRLSDAGQCDATFVGQCRLPGPACGARGPVLSKSARSPRWRQSTTSFPQNQRSSYAAYFK